MGDRLKSLKEKSEKRRQLLAQQVNLEGATSFIAHLYFVLKFPFRLLSQGLG